MEITSIITESCASFGLRAFPPKSEAQLRSDLFELIQGEALAQAKLHVVAWASLSTASFHAQPLCIKKIDVVMRLLRAFELCWKREVLTA